MIRTKTAFIIFIVLTVIVFPYYIFILSINSDFLNSIIPGWNTTIIHARVISNIFKFLILIVVSLYYFKLSGIANEIDLKKFLIHFSLTLPAVFIGKINLWNLIDFSSYNPEVFMNCIQIIVCLNIFINILFFCGQILFAINYIKTKRNKQVR